MRDWLPWSAARPAGPPCLLVGTVAALIWVNADASSYNTVWHTTFAMRFGHGTVSQDLRGWVNTGLMTLFFLVVGLEARREFDIGDLRERKRVTLPLLAGIAGMVVPIGIYLAFNGGRYECARLGRGNVDRYRVRTRHAGARRAAFSRPAKGFHAHGRGRRRHRRAARDRDRIHQASTHNAVARGCCAVRVRAPDSRFQAAVSAADVRSVRSRDVVGVVQVRRRPSRRRSRFRAPDLRLRGRPS